MSWKNVEYKDGKFRTSNGGGSSDDSYSTTEQVIGTWADNKPLYRKVVYFDNVSKAGNVSLGIANVKTIMLISGKISGNLPLPYIHGSSPTVNVGGFFEITSQDTSWEFRSGNDAASTLTGFLIVQYTKTTD